jgi:hypothetical protein
MKHPLCKNELEKFDLINTHFLRVTNNTNPVNTKSIPNKLAFQLLAVAVVLLMIFAIVLSLSLVLTNITTSTTGKMFL